MKGRRELIENRLQRAEEAIDLARLSIERKYWNSAANRLYYTCFYLILALFAKHELDASTHSGVKVVFGLEFIKKGVIEAKWEDFFSTLFSKRQDGRLRRLCCLNGRRNITSFKRS